MEHRGNSANHIFTTFSRGVSCSILVRLFCGVGAETEEGARKGVRCKFLYCVTLVRPNELEKNCVVSHAMATGTPTVT